MRKRNLYKIYLLLMACFALNIAVAEGRVTEQLTSRSPKQSDTLTARDVVKRLNGGLDDKGSRNNDDVSLGVAYTFNPSSVGNLGAVVLDENRFVVCYSDGNNSANGTVVVGVVSGTSISFGAEYAFTSSNCLRPTIAALSDETIVIAWEDQGNGNIGNVIVGTISGTTVSFGEAVNFNDGGMTFYISAMAIDATHFVLAYSDFPNTSYGTALVGTVSGATTISLGAETIFSAMSTVAITGTTLDATRVVIAYSPTTSGANAIVGTVNVGAASISFGTAKNYTVSVFDVFKNISKLDESHFVIAWKGGGAAQGYGKVVVGEVSGSSISFGTTVEFDPGFVNGNGQPNVICLHPSQFIIHYTNNDGGVYADYVIGNVSGKTIDLGSSGTFKTTASYYHAGVALSKTRFVFSFQTNDPGSKGMSMVGENLKNLTQDVIADETLCPTTENLAHTASTSAVPFGNFVDSDQNWIECNSIVPDLAGTNRSIFLWMKKTIAADENQAIIGINEPGGDYNISNMQVGTNGLFAIYDGEDIRLTAVNVADGNWHYVGYTYNEATTETLVYIDGNLELTFSDDQSMASNNYISLGQEFDGNNSGKGNYYEGYMTEVSFWNEILSPSDIALAMNAAITSAHPKHANLKAYYTMKPGTSFLQLEDQSGNGHHGNASHSDIIDMNLEQITGFDATSNYSIDWLANGSSVGTTATLDLASYDAGNYALKLYNDYVELLDEWVVTFDNACTDMTWTGASGTSWLTAANWTGGGNQPTATNNVIIPAVANQPTVLSGVEASAYNLTIENGAMLTIQTNDVGSASLIVNGTLTNNGGSFTVQRYLEDDAWHLVSPTTSGVTANDFYWNAAPICWLASHAEATNAWTYNTDLATAMPLGQGWSVWVDGATKTPAIANMTGNIQVEDFNIPLTLNGTGWNLIGNPFPSAIDSDLIDWSSTTGSPYVWDNDYNGGDYRTWNGTVGDLPEGIIPMSQGFFIKATAATTKTIPAAARVHNTLIPFYKSNQSGEASPYLRIQLSQGDYGNTVFIGFPENGTAYFDFKGDTEKLYSNSDKAQLYALEDGIKLSTNACAPLTVEKHIVPLHLDQVADGSYSLNFELMENLPGISIFLEDLHTQSIVDVNMQPTYTFTAAAGDQPDRFLLHFENTFFGLGEGHAPDLMEAYAADGNLYIRSNGNAAYENGTLSVFNINGQLLMERAIPSGSLISIPFRGNNQMLLLRVRKASAVSINKVFTK